MSVDEMVRELQRIKRRYGNCEVRTSNDVTIFSLEYDDDQGKVYVIEKVNDD